MSGDEFDAILSQDEAFFSQIDEDLDYAFALSLQEESKEISKPNTFTSKTSQSPSKPLGIVDEQWELLDPNPDIHALFIQYNAQFFYGKLEGVEVRWSPRMTLCAGVCSYEGRGGLCSVRLSLPLLKLRPRRDLVETLLHEMIHAYLFVTANYKDHNAHGPEFLKHMTRINKETGTKISVYHSFHDEVDQYRKHVWKCDGPCQSRRPFFGLVKRASNRAPNPRDFWWAQHQQSCGGKFIKIQEPEDYKNKNLKRKPMKDTSNAPSGIKKFLKSPTSEGFSKNSSTSRKTDVPMSANNVESVLLENANVVNLRNDGRPSCSKEIKNITPFSGKGFQLGSASVAKPKSFLACVRQEILSARMKDQKEGMPERSSSHDSGESHFMLPKKFKVKTEDKNASSKKPNAVSTNRDKSYVQSSLDKFVSSPSRSSLSEEQSPKVECPVCLQNFFNSDINAHLDACLSK